MCWGFFSPQPCAKQAAVFTLGGKCSSDMKGKIIPIHKQKRFGASFFAAIV